MIARALVLAAGLAGAGASSQFPEFSQQYVQRLGGAVDALGEVVADFDASAAAEGLTRQTALEQMAGSGFVERRRVDMQTAFARHDRLAGQLNTMRTAGPFTRAYHAASMDSDVTRAAWRDFKPALPLTIAGAMFAAFGFLLGGGMMSVIMASARAVFRPRHTSRA